MAGKREKPRRRWWQRLLRLAVVLALAAGAAYVTLPWWLPRAWVKDFFARHLSQTALAGVRISDLSVSWGEGLEISDLTIDCSAEEGALPLVSVSRLRADFSPLDLLRGKLAWMEVDAPRLYLRATGDGEIDLSVLSRLLKGDIRTDRISIRRAGVVLTLPYRVEPFHLEVGDVQILAGRLYPVGQLTMSAGLNQGASQAPVTFRFSEGPRHEGLVGRAKLSFQGLDLEALGLPQVPWLPLRHFRRLSGLASGELELAATTEGKINHFRLDISVRRLDAQPVTGQELPVFEQAGIKLEAGFDFLSGRLDVHSAQVRLPGMDLTGRAVAFLDSLGQWDRISSLKLDGTVYPQQLAALFGAGKDPNDFQVSGPVAVHFTGREPNWPRSSAPALQLTAQADATEAQIRRSDHVLKPAGRKLEVSLAGDLDGNDWSYSAAGEQVVLLGDNEFRGSGTLSRLRQLTERWSAKDRRWTAWDVPRDLSHLHWNGSWEIRDLASLADLWPAVGSLLQTVRLEGKITGECFLGQKEGNEIIFHAALPRGTWLSVPGVLVKPVDQDARFVLTARLDSDRSQWNDIDLVARMGEASFHLREGGLCLVGDDNADPVLTSQGKWELLGVESLLKVLDSPAAAGLDLSGAMEGSGSVSIGPAGVGGALEMQADRAALRTDAWIKPALQPAWCKLQFSAQPSDNGWTHTRLSAEYRSSGAEIFVKVGSAGADGKPGPTQTNCEFRAEVKDAAWLAQSCPPLGRLLAGGRLKGPAHLAGGARWNGDDLDGNVQLDGTGLDIASPGGAAVKPAGAPLTVRLEGALSRAPAPGAAVQLDLRRLQLAAANCSADILGKCEFDPSVKVTDLRDLARAIPAAAIAFYFHADRSLADLLPGLSAAIERFGIEGRADGSFRLDIGQTIDLKSSVDLTRLCAVSRDGFFKPADMFARVQASVSLARDLSSVDSFQVVAGLGESNLSADGRAKLAWAGPDAPRISQASGGLAVTVGDASQWAAMLPRLQACQPDGSLRLAAQWNDEGGLALSKVDFRTTGLSAVYRGRTVSLAGDLQAEGVTGLVAAMQGTARAPAAAEENVAGRSGIPARHSGDGNAESPVGRAYLPDSQPPTSSGSRAGMPDLQSAALPLGVARFSTDGLEFRAGENHGWVVADVAGPLGAAPSGRVRVLAEMLDDKDLADWLNGPGAASDGNRLAPAQVQKLEEDARRSIGILRRAIERSDVDIRCEIDRYRTFDADVSQSYEVRQMVLQADANKGKLRLQLAAGIGGGTFRRTQETNLADETPSLTCDTTFQEVLASQATRAQLSRFFPGNTVNGSFSHSEKLTMPLSSAVANMIDPRAPLHSAGPGETTALGGVVEGRAAPQFVTSIFPGLNTTRYNYNRMRAFTRQLPDGSAQSDMIFNSDSYDLYMEGTTDPNNIARYETGIILLSSPQTPELNHDLKLGRVPLLKIKARIEGGQLHDVEVSYPWPNESLGTMFIRNNPFYRIWVTYHDK